MTALRDLIELVRAPAALSVPGDVIAGAAIGGAPFSRLDRETAVGPGVAAGNLFLVFAACRVADQLAEATSEAFTQHPDAAIITSFPGLADLTGGVA
ncbi:hypothetical protein ETD86_12420 [Nonomuraea turkmeniaca]|uniref:Uncharacterized protein n=1 Tax=Nonomuraea turkmeniaca TaxID=103838 RepID=A0A5S4FNI6_9ACTN|nr:hypothetical protein [Nonomuraea turkmeniaca]TMR22235.1 hypothetical protein ETD86_12420 [Nonomuraea turkmeniaca]